MRRLTGGICGVMLTVAACSSSADIVARERDPLSDASVTPSPEPSPSSPTTSATSVTPPPVTEPTATEPTETDGGGVASFDETFTYEDGLRLSIVKVRTDRLSDTGCCARPGTPLVVFMFKLSNGTGKLFDPTGFSAQVSYGTRGKAAEQVFDSAQGLGDGFRQKLLPGRAAVADYAYAVPSREMHDVVVQVDVDFLEHDSVFFQGAVT